MPIDTATRWDGIIIRLRSQDESVMFPTLVKEALNKICSKPVGKSLLSRIRRQAGKKKFGYTVCIMRPGNLSIVDQNDGKGPQWSGGSVAKRMSEAEACDGTGTVTAITWNANSLATPQGPRPTFIGLAHELVHALYSLEGKGKMDTMSEEYRTVGCRGHEDDRSINENKIRAEHGVALRLDY